MHDQAHHAGRLTLPDATAIDQLRPARVPIEIGTPARLEPLGHESLHGRQPIRIVQAVELHRRGQLLEVVQAIHRLPLLSPNGRQMKQQRSFALLSKNIGRESLHKSPFKKMEQEVKTIRSEFKKMNIAISCCICFVYVLF